MTGVYERHRDKLKIDVDELMAEQPTDRTILWACPKFITTPYRHQYSATTNYITGTSNFNSYKDNMKTFEHFFLTDVLKVLSYIFILISHFRF